MATATRRPLSEFFGMLIAFGFPILGIAALVYLGVTGPRNRAAVRRDLFDAYVGHLVAGRYAQAHQHHSPERQARYSVDQLAAHYRTLTQEFGALKKHTIVTAYPLWNPWSRRSGYSVGLVLEFDQTGVEVKYGLSRDATGLLRIESAGSEQGGYVNQPLPW